MCKRARPSQRGEPSPVLLPTGPEPPAASSEGQSQRPQTPRLWEPDLSELSQAGHFVQASCLTQGFPRLSPAALLGRTRFQAANLWNPVAVKVRLCTDKMSKMYCEGKEVSFITQGIGRTHFPLPKKKKKKYPSCQISERQMLSKHRAESGRR